MLIEKIVAKAGELNLSEATLDEVYFEWYELNKKILRKTTAAGVELGFRLDGVSGLGDGDIVAAIPKQIHHTGSLISSSPTSSRRRRSSPTSISTRVCSNLFEYSESSFIVVRVIPCQCLAVSWHDWPQLAQICYEIGNRHAPLFINSAKDRLLLPFDEPMERLLNKLGAHTSVVSEKLITPLASLSGHSHAH